MRRFLKFVCLFAIGLMLAVPAAVVVPDAQAASAPASPSSVLPVAFLGIGGENEPDENDNEPDEGSPAAGQSQKDSSTSGPVLLLFAVLGFAAAVFGVKLVRRARARIGRFGRAQPRTRR